MGKAVMPRLRWYIVKSRWGRNSPRKKSRYFLTLLRSGQRNGVVQEHIDPPTVARMFLGTLLTYSLPDGLMQNIQAPQIPDPGAIDTFVDHMMYMISTRKTHQASKHFPSRPHPPHDPCPY